MKRAALLVVVTALCLFAGVLHPHPQPARTLGQEFGQLASQGPPPGVQCMWADITPDGHVTEYPAKDGGTITVPNGTPHPYVAKCINGSLTAQPGSGDMPS